MAVLPVVMAAAHWRRHVRMDQRKYLRNSTLSQNFDIPLFDFPPCSSLHNGHTLIYLVMYDFMCCIVGIAFTTGFEKRDSNTM